jgi:hypothetical protein
MAVASVALAAAACGGDADSADDASVMTPAEIADDIVAHGSGQGFIAEFCIDLVTYGEESSRDAFSAAFAPGIIRNAFGRDWVAEPRTGDVAFILRVWIAMKNRCP